MLQRTLLVIEDDPASVRLLQRVFEPQQWTVWVAPDGRTAHEILLREDPAVALMDLGLPDIQGMDLLESFRKEDRDTAVVVITGRAEVAVAVEAMRLGAENFLAKPIEVKHVEAVVERAFEKVALRRQNRAYAEQQSRQLEGRLEPTGSVSPALRSQIELMAGADSVVLLQGETGTGKSVVAQMIHAASRRARRPFVVVNCAGLSSTLLESELFGHERGAFTDAKTQKRGLFEVADGGTIFLDEVGDLAPELQPKLLSVLESRRFRRVGGTHEIEVDVRVIAATNRDLAEAIRSGAFREDLYYRLAVFPLHLPPLRRRSADEIVQLAYGVLEDLQERLGRGRLRISDEAMEYLVRYPWPGNIRELRNTLERCLIVGRGAAEIQVGHLPAEIVGRGVPASEEAGYDPLLTLAEVESRHIARVLRACGGNRARAAAILGISTRSIYDRIRRAGIDS